MAKATIGGQPETGALRAPLTRATREELIGRNVARMVELPAWEPEEVHPWSADEAMAFLQAAKPDPLYPAFGRQQMTPLLRLCSAGQREHHS